MSSTGETAFGVEERQAIEADCRRLIIAFTHLVDSRRYAELVALFAEDGHFVRPGVDAKGSAAISRVMNDRPTTIVTRHICGTTLFGSVSTNTASAVTYVTIYTGQGSDGEVIEVGGPAGVAEYHDDFVLMPDGWRIASRVAKPVFVVKK